MPDGNEIYKSIIIKGTQTLKVKYNYLPAYIGFIISIFGVFLVIMNKYYFNLKYIIYKLKLFVKKRPIKST